MATQIDVIIPHLNYGRYLRKCLESIFSQNVNKNVYLIDGGSIDNTFDILKDFSEVKVCKVKGNLRTAITYGLSHSQGNYIICFASDNVMLPDFLELAQQTLDANEDVGLVYGGAIKIDPEGKILGLLKEGGPFSKKRLRRKNFIDWSAGVFRREAWGNKEFPEWVVYHLDWFVWLAISERWRIVDLERPVICYREHPESHSSLKQHEILQEYIELKMVLHGEP